MIHLLLLGISAISSASTAAPCPEGTRPFKGIRREYFKAFDYPVMTEGCLKKDADGKEFFVGLKKLSRRGWGKQLSFYTEDGKNLYHREYDGQGRLTSANGLVDRPEDPRHEDPEPLNG